VLELKIIVLVGMPGAGKSTCVDYLTAKNLPSVYFGGIVVDETKRRYGKVDESLEKIVREDLRDKEGNGAIAQRVIVKIKQLFSEGHKAVVADGLYSWSEYKIFKKLWGDDAVVIAIAAPRRLRHTRLAQRPLRSFSEVDVTAREYAEIENIEKGGPIANADYTIVNDSDSKAMFTKLDSVLNEAGIILKTP
jgi:dephospho-CoA kinase